MVCPPQKIGSRRFLLILMFSSFLRIYRRVVSEIYHEHLPKGTVLGTDNEGKAKGNELKRITKITTFDNDIQVEVDFLHKHPMCNGRVGCVGFCMSFVF
jgi:carboxymethylenebutenolidase